MKFLSIIIVLSVTQYFVGCGKTEFTSGATAQKTAAPEQPSEEIVKPEEADVVAGIIDEPKDISWLWQCDRDSVELPLYDKNKTHLITGAGVHQLDVPSTGRVALNISGSLCPPSTLERDIVIIVDVSGSTEQTDPAVIENQAITCERKKAVSKLIKTFSQHENINVGLLSFSSGIVRSSNSLLPPKNIDEAFFANNTLCASDGGTNYVAALQSAQSLLEAGRTAALKEVYFITDGVPNDTQESQVAAQALRNRATIATIMFGGADDTHLKNDVASVDSDGKAIHASTEKSDELTAALAELAKTYPVSGTYKYRLAGAEDWTEKDLWPHVDKGQFELEGMSLITDESKAIEFSYAYINNRNNRVEQSGEIIWKNKTIE